MKSNNSSFWLVLIALAVLAILTWYESGKLLYAVAVPVLTLIVLYLFQRKDFLNIARRVKVSSDCITVSNLWWPFRSCEYFLREFDGFYLAEEILSRGRGGIRKEFVACFCKDEIVVLKIARNYRNFYDLIGATGLPFKGFLKEWGEDEYEVGDKISTADVLAEEEYTDDYKDVLSRL